MSQYDPPDPPPDPTHVECAGDCGAWIDVDEAYRLRVRGVEESLCLFCALDALHRIGPLNSTTIGSTDLADAAIVYGDAARECRRLAAQEARPELGASTTPPVAPRSAVSPREDSPRAVIGETFRALVAAGPRIGDLATYDLAHAVTALAAERDAARRDGLEEAAKICDANARPFLALPVEHLAASGALTGETLAARKLALIIRARAGQPPDPVREAAPELLAALRGVIPILERMDTLRHLSPEFPALDCARAAIAKATLKKEDA